MPEFRFKIEIRNEASGIPVSLSRIKKVGISILKSLRLKKASLSVLLVDDKTIRKFNKRYLGHDRSTDVIAFGVKSDRRYRGSEKKEEKDFLGDLMISLSTAKRQAAEYGNSFFYELCFYLCHGILHLRGYRDKTKKDAQRMERRQTSLLNKIGISKTD